MAVKGIGKTKPVRGYAHGGTVTPDYGYGPETNFFPDRNYGLPAQGSVVPPIVTIDDDPLTYAPSAAVSYGDEGDASMHGDPASGRDLSMGSRSRSPYGDYGKNLGRIGSVVGAFTGATGLGTLGTAAGVGLEQAQANKYLEAAGVQSLGWRDYMSALLEGTPAGWVGAGTSIADAVRDKIGGDPTKARDVAQSMMDYAREGMSPEARAAADERAAQRDAQDAAWGREHDEDGGAGGGGLGGGSMGENDEGSSGNGDWASGGKIRGIGGTRTVSDLARKGTIKGPGGGQDDLIAANVANDEHIWDADTVSALGDGSSDQGHRILDKTKQLIRKDNRSASTKTIPKKSKGLVAYINAAKRSVK